MVLTIAWVWHGPSSRSCYLRQFHVIISCTYNAGEIILLEEWFMDFTTACGWNSHFAARTLYGRHVKKKRVLPSGKIPESMIMCYRYQVVCCVLCRSCTHWKRVSFTSLPSRELATDIVRHELRNRFTECQPLRHPCQNLPITWCWITPSSWMTSSQSDERVHKTHTVVVQQTTYELCIAVIMWRANI